MARLEREHDYFIMDEVVNSTWFTPAREVKLINLCRLYLQVLTISGITSVEGTHLNRFMKKGEDSLYNNNKLSIVVSYESNGDEVC